jgi:Protein of unknown function (DUF4446)
MSNGVNFQLSTISLILGGLALVLAAYCAWQIVLINKLKKTFFAGSKALGLESVIYTLRQEQQDSQKQLEILEEALIQLKTQNSFAVQKVGLVRFNPFNDGGGNFSFCLTLLNQHNSGIIITSMYGREQNRIYTKKIDQGKCDIQLTDEEQQAVQKANDEFQISNSKIS